MELSISNKLFRNIKNNRWQHEFSEREKIGAGGFASVYKATNCFDDHTYAVKKIKLQFKDIRRNFEQELQKVLDEAKLLAKLKHDNILRYYGSWLEATTKPNRVGKRNHAIRPSIFKKQRENINFLNIDTFCESDQENARTPEVGSPLVVFGESEKSEKVCENSLKKPCEDVEKHIIKKENFFPQKPSKFAGRRPDLHHEEGLKIQTNMRATASEPEECITPLVRGEKLENIILFIQTELCSDTLETYIDARNETLLQLKKQNEEEYQKRRKEYLREALVFAKQILNGLAHIHSHFVVHRDLKPSNIFIANKVCKIGDFGLVKQLVSLYPVENSPLSAKDEKVNDSLGSFQESLSASANLAENSKKSSSDSSYGKDKECHSDNETHITKNTGTRMYASPEQWMADKDTFDYRADIFSLGVTFLLLFHPMSTCMERTNTIKESKEGKIPESLEKELPEIAEIIKKMLSLEPSSRPSIEKILQSLKLPCAIKSQICGSVNFRKENALRWRKKYFKVIDGSLHIFSREHERKAENVFNLSHWKMTLEGQNKLTRGAPKSDNESNDSVSNKKEACVKFENPDQLGCEIKPENSITTEELFKNLERCMESC